MSTLVDFVPSTLAAFSFQATLSGAQYTITVTWNVFGQRYYINVTDLSGNLIICRALTSSAPGLLASFVWDDGVATATTLLAHNVPVGSVALITVAQTDSGFDGTVQALAISSNAFTYALPNSPNEAEPVNGVVAFNLNLVAGVLNAYLLFHDETQQFEFA